jgi:hypothetical protein
LIKRGQLSGLRLSRKLWLVRLAIRRISFRYGNAAREFVTHWFVAGVILAATGAAAPEHWIAELVQEVHFPHEAMAFWLGLPSGGCDRRAVNHRW